MSLLGRLSRWWQNVLHVSVPGRTSDHGRGSSGEVVDTGSVLAISTAYACVRLRSGTVATLPLGIYREESGGHAVPVKDHPLWRLLHRAPNSEQTAVDFWEGGTASLDLRGNMIARKERSVDGSVSALLPMAWDMTQAKRGPGGFLEYHYGDEVLSADDVLHVRGFGGSPEGGLSTISLACETFASARAVDRSAAKMLGNGLRPSGILSLKEKLDGPQRAELEELLREKYAGSMNSGRPMLLDNEMSWESLSINPEEAQLLETRRFSVEEVCRIFGVPPHMVGHTEKSSSWGTGLEQQTLAFQKFTLRPVLKRIELALEQQLFTPDDVAAGLSIQFNLEGLLRGDSKGRSEFYGSGLKDGWLTINEVRAKEGLPPVAGGDVPRIQMQNVPLSEAGSGDGL